MNDSSPACPPASDPGQQPPDYAALSYEQRADLLAELVAEQARLDARRVRLLAAMQADAMPNADGSPALDKEWTREEVALILRLSSQTARALMMEASELVTRFPATLAALESGMVTLRQAVRLVEACRSLDQATAMKVEQRVLRRAGEMSLAQFGACVRRAVARLAPQQADDAYRDAVAERRVAITPRIDGTGELWALLPAPELAAMQDRIRDLAHRYLVDEPTDERTHEQREADALAQLVLSTASSADGRSDSGMRPVVNVTVAVSTLLGADEQPGELDGYGPIPATVARALASDPRGTWRRLLTDPNNRLVDVSADTYRPPANMARLVRAQHRSCCFPGCRRSGTRTELDHIIAWAGGGETTPQNLQPLCRRHHRAKHDAGWQVHREPDGTTRWRSPTGHTYARPPDDELPVDTTALAEATTARAVESTARAVESTARAEDSTARAG